MAEKKGNGHQVQVPRSLVGPVPAVPSAAAVPALNPQRPINSAPMPPAGVAPTAAAAARVPRHRSACAVVGSADAAPRPRAQNNTGWACCNNALWRTLHLCRKRVANNVELVQVASMVQQNRWNPNRRRVSAAANVRMMQRTTDQRRRTTCSRHHAAAPRCLRAACG